MSVSKFEMKTCWCGKEFMQTHGGQKYCCPRHQRIWTRAQRCKWRDFIETDPGAVLEHYSFMK